MKLQLHAMTAQALGRPRIRWTNLPRTRSICRVFSSSRSASLGSTAWTCACAVSAPVPETAGRERSGTLSGRGPFLRSEQERTGRDGISLSSNAIRAAESDRRKSKPAEFPTAEKMSWPPGFRTRRISRSANGTTSDASSRETQITASTDEDGLWRLSKEP